MLSSNDRVFSSKVLAGEVGGVQQEIGVLVIQSCPSAIPTTDARGMC